MNQKQVINHLQTKLKALDFTAQLFATWTANKAFKLTIHTHNVYSEYSFLTLVIECKSGLWQLCNVTSEKPVSVTQFDIKKLVLKLLLELNNENH